MDQTPDAVPPMIPSEPPPAPGGLSIQLPTLVQPWGVWATIGWTLLIGLAYMLTQAAAVFVYAGPDKFSASQWEATLDALAGDGFLLSTTTILSMPVGVGFCVFFAWLRRGIRVRDYLGWKWPGRRRTVLWCVAVLVFGAASDLVTTLVLKRPLVPEVMVELYRNAGVRPLLWLAIVVAAPVAEEFIFRGFLFTGLRGLGLSGWRNLAAVVATAGVWAGIHFQYDAFGVASVFLGGLLLGYARLRTGSLWLCIVLHAIMNLVATVEVEVMLA